MLLTIGIPTYNRTDFLKENLDVLLPQLKPYVNDVELIISDNASDEDTGMIVNKTAEEYDVPLSFQRQKVNLGAEGNALWIVEKARGRYLYLMGDDDILSPNFMDIIIPLLKSENDFVAIHWNRLSGNAECTNNVLSDKTFTGKTEDVLDPKAFITRVMDRPNFISSIIFKKEVLGIGKPYYKDKYYGYCFFAQMYFGILLSGGICLYYYFPLVIQRNPTKSWEKYWPQYLISSSSNIFLDMDTFIPGIYHMWMQSLRRDIPKYISSVSRFQDYYRQPAVRVSMAKHMTRRERLMFYYYLIPGTYFLHRVNNKLKGLLKNS